MILGFKPQFVKPITTGSKIHSIREDKPDRWKEGNTIHFATGVRTKNYNNFKTDTCKGTQIIEIIWKSGYINDTVVKVDGKELTLEEKQRLAWNDGFVNLFEFYTWFSSDFKGKIIHWTDFKYNKQENK